MPWWTGHLGLKMFSTTFSTKPFPKWFLTYCSLEPWEQISFNFSSNYANFDSSKHAFVNIFCKMAHFARVSKPKVIPNNFPYHISMSENAFENIFCKMADIFFRLTICLKLEYSSKSRSIPWQLMIWLLVLPSATTVFNMEDKPLSFMRKKIYLPKWQNVNVNMSQVTEVLLSCYLLLLSFDSKTR